MRTVVVQLTELFGMSRSRHAKVFPMNRETVSTWALTKLLITKNTEYLNKCIGTLTSLYKLLDEIPNIVISEEIRVHIETALNNHEAAVSSMHRGAIREAVGHARRAYEASEKAFYDASLLSLLYFPDDQKYAIYIPLFLPAAFPVVSSVYRTFLWYRGKATS